MPYVAPVKDMLFVMNELAGLSEVVAYPSYAEVGADIDLAPAILEESAKLKDACDQGGDQRLDIYEDAKFCNAKRAESIIPSNIRDSGPKNT